VRTRSPQVLDRRNEARGAQHVRPGVARLAPHLPHAATPRQLVEGRAGLGEEDDRHRLDRELRQLDRFQEKPRRRSTSSAARS
jgi:hypothetical protein